MELARRQSRIPLKKHFRVGGRDTDNTGRLSYDPGFQFPGKPLRKSVLEAATGWSGMRVPGEIITDPRVLNIQDVGDPAPAQPARTQGHQGKLSRREKHQVEFLAGKEPIARLCK